MALIHEIKNDKKSGIRRLLYGYDITSYWGQYPLNKFLLNKLLLIHLCDLNVRVKRDEEGAV